MKALTLISLSLCALLAGRVPGALAAFPERYCANKMQCYKENLHESLLSCGCANVLKRRTGYWAAWSRRRACDRFNVEDINPYLYTDLHYAFAYITADNTIAPASAEDPDVYLKFNALKRINPLLRTHISIGGWAFNYPPTDKRFSIMASTKANREKFIYSVILFLRKYDFNGVEINWLYPGYRGGDASDRANLVELMRDFRTEFEKNNDDFSLSLAIPASEQYLAYFDLPSLVPLVTTFNLMSYDYHGSCFIFLFSFFVFV